MKPGQQLPREWRLDASYLPFPLHVSGAFIDGRSATGDLSLVRRGDRTTNFPWSFEAQAARKEQAYPWIASSLHRLEV